MSDSNKASHYLLRFKTADEACRFLVECTVHTEES